MLATRRTALRVTAAAIATRALAAQAAPVAVPVRGVIELYTSQGCSSCPPADRLAGQLATDPSLVVLTLPVDYWDRLGWKDSLARHAFSERQQAYAGEVGERSVYTPQAVVNGVTRAIGSDRAAILERAAEPLPVQLTLAADLIHLDGPAAAGGMVLAMPFLRTREVAIGRGENARNRVTYTNVVRDVTVLGQYLGGRQRFARPDFAVDSDMGFAVLVQQGALGRPGRIVGAAAV